MCEATQAQLLLVAQRRAEAVIQAVQAGQGVLSRAHNAIAALAENPPTPAQQQELTKEWQAQRQAAVDAAAGLPLDPLAFPLTAQELGELFPNAEAATYR